MTTDDHAPARDSWESAIPGDTHPTEDDARLPDQVGENYTLREGATGEPTAGSAPDLVQEGAGYARQEETAAQQQVPAAIDEHGRPLIQRGQGYAREDATE